MLAHLSSYLVCCQIRGFKMGYDINSPEGEAAMVRGGWLNVPTKDFIEASAEAKRFMAQRQASIHSSMTNFDKFVNAAEAIKYLDSATKEGDTYTLIGCGKSLQIKERFNDEGNREVLLWSKSAPTELRKVVGASLEKVLPRLVVQHFTGVKNVTYTDHKNHKHIYEDVGFFPVSVHNNMTRFSDAIGRKWICIASGSDVPNITLAFYKLLYDGRTDMSAMMMPNLIPLDDVKLVKSGVGGRPVEVYEEPELPEPSSDFVVSSVEDFKRALPDLQELVLFPHQGDVPDYGYRVFKDTGMVVSAADRPFIAGAEKTIKEFIGSSEKKISRHVNSAVNSVMKCDTCSNDQCPVRESGADCYFPSTATYCGEQRGWGDCDIHDCPVFRAGAKCYRLESALFSAADRDSRYPNYPPEEEIFKKMPGLRGLKRDAEGRFIDPDTGRSLDDWDDDDSIEKGF